MIKTYINDKMNEVRKLLNELESSLEEEIDKRFYIIEHLERIIGENPIVIKYQSICLYNAGFVKEANEYLSLFLEKYSKNYDLFDLKYQISKNIENIDSLIYYLTQMFKNTTSEQLRDEIIEELEKILTKSNIVNSASNYIEYFKKEIASTDYRAYPIDEYGKSIIRENAFYNRDGENSYIVNLYKSIQALDVDTDSRYYFLFEMIKGILVSKRMEINAKKGDIIAISSAVKEGDITNIRMENLENDVYRLLLEPNNIRYFNIKKDHNLKIETDRDILISYFKKNSIKNKPKLILQIFIDGLSYDFLENNNFCELMPNVFNFFKSGYINKNCHCNGEWTLPSLMSMSTGKYTTNHYVYHTSAPHKGEINNKYVHEYFAEEGYVIGRICSNWRGTPSYGYFKSTDRSIYSPMVDRMYCSEAISETLEHIKTFRDFHNYVWLTLEDLHAVADGLLRGAFLDTNIDKYRMENSEGDSEISVFKSFSEKKIEEYKATMKKIDFYLGVLFDYVLQSYKEDEFMITLNSDHGQKFIEKEDYLFTKKRTNVPFMMRGHNVKPIISNQLMSNVDIFPTLLHLCNIQYDKNIDGIILNDFGGPSREYTITESIFPGQTYKLAINDLEHLFMFETVEFTREDGLIPIEKYQVQLLNLESGEDKTLEYSEKVNFYLRVTFEHIKQWVTFV